jgi:hypothetical protein
VEEYPDHLYVSLLRASATGDGETGGAATVEELRVFLGPRWVVSLGRIDPDGSAALVDVVARQVLRGVLGSLLGSKRR